MKLRVLAYNQMYEHFGEMEQPPGSNRGTVVDWAIGPWISKEQKILSLPWCAGAVCTAYLEAGSKDIKLIGSLSVDRLFLGVSKVGEVQLRKQSSLFYPEHGDFVFFGKSRNNLTHVGLIDKYDVESGCMYTLEGNHNNGVFCVFRKDCFAIGKIFK